LTTPQKTAIAFSSEDAFFLTLYMITNKKMTHNVDIFFQLIKGYLPATFSKNSRSYLFQDSSGHRSGLLVW